MKWVVICFVKDLPPGEVMFQMVSTRCTYGFGEVTLIIMPDVLSNVASLNLQCKLSFNVPCLFGSIVGRELWDRSYYLYVYQNNH